MSIQSVKNVCQNFYKESWKPLKRIEGNNIVKDLFLVEGNLKKIAARTFILGIATLLGVIVVPPLILFFPILSAVAFIGVSVGIMTGRIPFYSD